jgi:hypothetical protein
MHGAVLEGCSAAGKTSVLKALKRVQAERDLERSVVIVGEHYSQALQKLGGERVWLSLEEHRDLLCDRLEALEALARWGARLDGASRNARGVFFVLERFHLNHRLTYPDDVAWSADVEARLARLHGVCCLLTVSEPCVPARIEVRLRTGGKPHDAAHVQRAAREFLENQERFLAEAKRSALPTLTLATDDQDWDRCARTILDYF